MLLRWPDSLAATNGALPKPDEACRGWFGWAAPVDGI